MFYGLKYTNDLGDSILFGSDAYKVIELEGFGEVQADIQTQKAPYRDGSTYIDSALQERSLYINFAIRGEQYSDLTSMRRAMGKLFNPKIAGTLSLTFDGEIRQIRCYPEHVPMFPDGGTDAIGRMQTVGVDLIALNPYWQSDKITEEPAFEGLFEWPSIPYWEEGEDGDLYFEMGVQRNDRLIYNDGDAPAPIYVDFYGPANAPIIENLTTGEFIRINKPLLEGETFRINAADSSVVYVNEAGVETSVFNWIDLESTFFKLAIGENDITCHCAISNNQKDFDIYYHKLYNAV